MLVVVLGLISLFLQHHQVSAVVPGRAIFWNHGDAMKGNKYNHFSKAVKAEDVAASMKERLEGVEVLAFVSGSSKNSVFEHPAIKSSFSASPKKMAWSALYATENNAANAEDRVMSAVSSGPVHHISLSELSNILGKSDHLTNSKVDVFHIELNGKEQEEDFAPLRHNKIMMAAIENPSTDAVPPEERAHFSRILTGTSSDVTDGLAYKPEGSEYSIFYQNTYLYITPDIFTGLMTGLFMFFVILIGVSCLGSIQGMSSFYDKTPAIGREN